MIIKDRLIEVDVTEALAIAGKGEKVRCVGEGTGLMTIADALEGLTFFAPESALTEKPEPIRIEASKDEIAKLAKSAFVPGGVVRYDTPEARTRAIIDSVERYDEEHGDPPITKQEEPKQEAPKQEPPRAAKTELRAAKTEPRAEAFAKEYSGEGSGFVPFEGAPSGGR